MAASTTITRQSAQTAQRRTSTRTFRIYTDQLEFIEATNSDCASFFIRYLLDLWIDGKIPHFLQEEYFKSRREVMHKADVEKMRLSLKNKKEKRDLIDEI